MRHVLKIGVLAGALVFGWVPCAVIAQEKKEVVFLDSAKMEFKSMAPGASMAVIKGDPDKGPFAVFVKFEPGAKFDMHSHSSELRAVVVKGAYLYKSPKGEEHRVGPGMYWMTPAGDHHWSGGDEKEGALFYLESEGKFDLIPDKK